MSIDFCMWGKALTTMPRLTKPQWDKLDVVAKWLIATRSAVFVMTAFSVIVGAIIALDDGKFNTVNYLLCLVGLVLAHATNNLVNDITDGVRGVDNDNYFRTMYGPQAFQNGFWSKKTFMLVTAFTGLAALACGAVLLSKQGDVLFWPFIIGVLAVLFYTWPLKLIGLGEPLVLLVWGPLMVGGSYAAITGHWVQNVALIGLVYAIGPTTVLFGKHTDKLVEDSKKRIHTLPVILGEKYARYSVIAMLLLQQILVVILVIAGILDWPMLIFLLGLPKVYQTAKVFTQLRPTKKPAGYPDAGWPTYLASYAFVCNRVTGSLFIVGLVLSLLTN